MIWRVQGQWLYWWHTPVVYVDRVTGRAYGLVPGVTNAQAAQLARRAK